MKFCDECGSMMKTDDDAWVCGSCGHEELRDAEEEAKTAVTTQGQEETGVIDTSEVGAEDMGPTTETLCPE